MEKSQVEDTEEGLHMEVEEEARPRPTSSADVTTELVSDDEPQDTNTVDQIVSHKGQLNIDVIDPLHCAVKKFGDEKCDYIDDVDAATHKDGDDSSRSFRVRSPVMAQPPVHFVDLDEIKLKDDSDSAEEISDEQNSETDTCTCDEGEGSQSEAGGEALFKCSKYAHCKKVFTSAVDLTAHQGNKYSCTVCGEAFPKLKGLGEHMRRHTEKQDLKDMKSLTCTCPICKKAFESDSLLKQHVLIHAFRHKPYICKICNKTFDLKQRLEYHQRRCRYKCGFCDGKFITKGELIEHVKVHQSTGVMSGEESIKSTSPGEKSLKSADANSQGSESVFKCLYCDREFQKKSQLEVHEIIHTRNRSSDVFARGPFVCEFCGRKFASPAGLGTHERVHTTQHQYKCSFCRKHFNSNADLAIHVRTHQTRTSKPYVCGFCNATFLQENDHECGPLGDDSQSGSTDMLVQDSTEDETFDITNSLSTNRQKIASGRDIALGEGQGHLSSPEVALTTEGNHGNVEVSDDVCEDNGLKLSGEFSGDNKVVSPKMATSEAFEMLNRDQKLPSRSKTRHENRKKRDTVSSSHRDLNYKCKNCPSAFRLESELEKHNTQNHICNICGRILANKYTLSAHLNTHTQDPNYKPFKCPYCDKTFMHKNGLRKHITVHSGVRQHICDICQKTFRLRHLLNQHRKIHVGNTDLLKYRCDFCQKCFKRKELCNQHIREHMTGDPLACKRYCHHCHIVFKKMYPSDVYPHVKPGHISGHADNE